MREPIWISENMALTIHEEQIAEHGGRTGLKSAKLLSIGLAKPRYLYTYGESMIFVLAAAYGHGLATSHAFADGNRRTAFMVTYVFLGLNGYSLEAPEKEAVRMMERLSAGQETQESFTRWLEARSVSNE